MRTIKFRGKVKANNHWVYGSLINYGDDCISIKNSKSEPWVIPSTIGQFSGLHDLTGKEIYEGDIVELNGPNGYIHNEYVSFRNGQFVIIDPQAPYRTNRDALCWYSDSIRVIGNIHDNPELNSP